MPAPTLPAPADPGAAWRLFPAAGDAAWRFAWLADPAAPPAEILVAADAPPPAAPEDAGADEIAATGVEPASTPVAARDLPAACNAAITGQNGLGSQPPTTPATGEASPAAGVVGANDAAPGGADTPAPGTDAADLPAACNAVRAGQNGPGSASLPDLAEEEPDWAAAEEEEEDTPRGPAGNAGEMAADGPADRGGQDLPPGLAALLAALEAENRAADAWLEDFLADRVEAESAFDLGPSGGVSDWPLR